MKKSPPKTLFSWLISERGLRKHLNLEERRQAMCNEKVIRDDLSEIKYYYSRQKELDGYMSEGLPSNVLNIVQRYANLIQKAPIRLYHVYVI